MVICGKLADPLSEAVDPKDIVTEDSFWSRTPRFRLDFFDVFPAGTRSRPALDGPFSLMRFQLGLYETTRTRFDDRFATDHLIFEPEINFQMKMRLFEELLSLVSHDSEIFPTFRRPSTSKACSL